MKRSTLDKLISSTGLIIAVILVAASFVLFYTHNFIHTQVQNQLSDQKIVFPAKGSPAITTRPAIDQTNINKYAGEQMITGQQARVFADNYIAVHLKQIGGGYTYSQVSTKAMADPTNAALAGQANVLFQGETLRGLLLNAYAFDTMALVAYWAGIGALAAGILLFMLAALGFSHAGRVSNKK